MLRLTDCEDRRSAERLADHLLVAEIDTDVREGAQWELWVINEDDVPRARIVHAGLDPSADDREVRAQAKAIRAGRSTAAIGHAQRFVPFRERWNPVSEVGMQPLTLGLIVVSAMVAWATQLGDPTSVTLQQLSIEPWDSSDFLGQVRRGEVWRLVTPMFIHFGLLHLVFNMAWLRLLGQQIERHHGLLIMAAVVIASEVVGSLAQYAAVGQNFGGMSGVVYGTFGFVWMHARFGTPGTYVLTDTSVVLSMVWFVACATGGLGPVANLGHAGGLVVGLLAGLPPYLNHLRGRRTALENTVGSWAEVHGTPWGRFRRRVLMPYMPVWFLAIAVVVIALELR